MAGDGTAPTSADVEALARKVAQLNQKLEDYQAAQSQTRWTVRIMTVAILASAIFGVYSLLSPLSKVITEPKPYRDAILADFNEMVLPRIRRELDESYRKVGPVLLGSIQKSFEKRQPELVRVIDVESQKLLADLMEMTQSELQARLEGMNKKVYDRIIQDIPELKDPSTAETVVGNAQVALESAVNRVIQEKLKRHIDAVLAIERELNAFPIPVEVQKLTDTELGEELVNTLGIYSTFVMRRGLPAEVKQYLSELTK